MGNRFFVSLIATSLLLANPFMAGSGERVCGLGQVFEDINRDLTYECGECDKRAIHLLAAAKKQGVDLAHASVLWISRLHGGIVQETHRFGKPQGWANHFVVEYQGKIYDYDLSDKPTILSTADYFKKAFPDSIGKDSDYLVRRLPAQSILNLGNPTPVDFYTLSKGSTGRLGNPDSYPRLRAKDYVSGKHTEISTAELISEEVSFRSRPISEQVKVGETMTLFDRETGKDWRIKKVLKVYSDGWALVETPTLDGMIEAYVDLKKMDPTRTIRGNALMPKFAKFSPDDLIYYEDREGVRHEGYVLGFNPAGNLRILPKGAKSYIDLGEYDVNYYSNMGVVIHGRKPASAPPPVFAGHSEAGGPLVEAKRSAALTQAQSYAQLTIEQQKDASAINTFYPKWSLGAPKPWVVRFVKMVGKKADIEVFKDGKWHRELISLGKFNPAKTRRGWVPPQFTSLNAGQDVIVTFLVDGHPQQVTCKFLHFDSGGKALVLPPGSSEPMPIEGKNLSVKEASPR